MKADRRYTIVIATGGTCGHIHPAVALLQYIEKDIEKKFKVVFVIDNRGFNFIKNVVKCSIFRIFSTNSATYLSRILLLPINCLRLLYLFITIRPKCIICFGGYASLAPAFTAFIMSIPIVVHEQNAVLGKSNRIVSHFCKSLAISFPYTMGLSNNLLSKVVVTGLPIRPAVLDIAKDMAKSTQYKAESVLNITAKNKLGSSFFMPVKIKKSNAKDSMLSVLVICGSQGAKIFSNIVPNAINLLPHNKRKRVVITQQVRQEDIKNVREFYYKIGVKFELNTFFQDIGNKIATHDLIVSRAGASTIFELVLFQKQLILVPLPSASNNHQFYNAMFICNNLGALLIPQYKFSAIKLCNIITRMLKNRSKLKACSNKNHNFLCESAAQNLAALL